MKWVLVVLAMLSDETPFQSVTATKSITHCLEAKKILERRLDGANLDYIALCELRPSKELVSYDKL